MLSVLLLCSCIPFALDVVESLISLCLVFFVCVVSVQVWETCGDLCGDGNEGRVGTDRLYLV